jgi:hypothetical protein
MYNRNSGGNGANPKIFARGEKGKMIVVKTTKIVVINKYFPGRFL